jgi:hypothetical protein
MMKYTLRGLPASQARTDSLMADFSGLENLEKVVDSVLERLRDQAVGMRIGYRAGTFSKEDFDGYFSELIRTELGKVLAIQRAKAVEKARMAGAGSAASAVLRRMYKDGHKGNINIATNRRRISSQERMVPEPDGGKSGIRRHRTIQPRTKKIQGYYGPDRGFILRIMESGRDVFYARPDGPTGRRSGATYGKRGAMGARNWFFHSMKADMELAAQQLGQTLTGAVEKWVEQQFQNYTE